MHLKTQFEMLIDFGERRNASWPDYKLDGERNVSEVFPGGLEITPPWH